MEDKINFNDLELDSLFDKFISNYPESYHPFDIERFYDFIIETIEKNRFLDIEPFLKKALIEKGINEIVAIECSMFYNNMYTEIIEFYKYYRRKK